MCYVYRLKGSMYLVPGKCEAGSQKCCKDLAKAKLDLRNAANSLQIEGKEVLPGDTTHWGGGEAEDGNGRDHIYINIYIYIGLSENVVPQISTVESFVSLAIKVEVSRIQSPSSVGVGREQ